MKKRGKRTVTWILSVLMLFAGSYMMPSAKEIAGEQRGEQAESGQTSGAGQGTDGSQTSGTGGDQTSGSGQEARSGQTPGENRETGTDSMPGSGQGVDTDSGAGSDSGTGAMDGGSQGPETGSDPMSGGDPVSGQGQGGGSDQAVGTDQDGGAGQAVGAEKGDGSGQSSGSSQGSGAGQAVGTDQDGDSDQTVGTDQGSGAGQAVGTDQDGGAGQTAGSEQGSGSGQTAGSSQGSGSSQSSGSSQGSGTSQSSENSQTGESGKAPGSSQSAGPDQPDKGSQGSGSGQTPDTDRISDTVQAGETVQGNTSEQSDGLHPIEDLDEEKIFRVVLPTDTSHVFDFIMDPQQLITKTSAAAYDGSLFEEGATLFFKRSDGKSEEEYSSRSDEVRITNMGTASVKVSLSASVSPDSIKGIAMAEDPDFTDDEAPGLYLALTDGERTIPIDSEGNATITIGIEGVPEGEVNIYSFRLEGAVNSNADWSELTDIAPEVTVTWKVAMEEEEVLENDLDHIEQRDETTSKKENETKTEKATPSQLRDLPKKKEELKFLRKVSESEQQQ